MFSPKPEKKFGVDPSCRFREKRKNRTFNSENDVPCRRLGYFNNQLNC